MAEALKILGQALLGSTSRVDAYTVPANTSAVVSSIVVTNGNSSGVTFTLSVAKAGAAFGAAQILCNATAIALNGVVTLQLGITLAAGDVVRISSNTANSVNVNLFGQEIS